MKKLCIVMSVVFVVLMVISLAFTVLQKNVPLMSKVGLIRVEGPIMDSKEVVDEIKEYAKDASIRVIVLRIDSPGGGVAASQEIYAEVKKTTARKPVVVSMGSIAASGGYYIACPASTIIANPGTLTGSIGVIMEIPNVEGLMTKIGVKTEVIKSGENKDTGSVFRTMTKEERELLQSVSDNIHEQFIKAVADGRKIKPEDVRKIADGRIFSGEQALANGLVNRLGTLEDAIGEAARLAGIKDEPHVVSKEEKLTFIDLIRNKFPKEITDVLPTIKIKYLYTP